MMSAFVWLDYSERERRKMLDVVDLFREHDTRDELGVGSVRDAFADMLFPSKRSAGRIKRTRTRPFQTWGFTDKYSWIDSHSRGTRGEALPFDRSYPPKAAYRALLQESLVGRVPGHREASSLI
jgi:Family of unknown function (DUF6361)/Glycosyl hydrolase family 10